MRIKVKPTEKIQVLKEDIENRKGSAEIEDDKIIVETEDTDFLEKVPGVKEFTVDGETKEGLKGRPLHEQAYIRIEDKRDAVEAFLATMDGYNLIVLNSGRDWDIRKLKEYNSGIKHLKADEPRDYLGVEKSIGEIKNLESVEMELTDEEVKLVYREMHS